MRSKEEMTAIFENCKKDLKSIGIHTGTITKFEVKKLRANEYGHANFVPDSSGNVNYEILVSDLFQEDEVSENSVRGIIFHELLHAVPECLYEGHEGIWKELASKVEAAYPGCPVISRGSHGVGIPEQLILDRFYKGKAKYLVRCDKCGTAFFHKKLTNHVLHCEDYQCRCGGLFSRVETIGEIPAEDLLKLNQAGVVTIPYRNKK